MGFETYGPTQRPRPARPVTVPTTIGALEQRQRQDDRKLPGKDRVTGTPVAGSSSVQQFTISSPGSDGFTITLPGNPILPWKCSLTLAASSFEGETFIVTPLMAGTAYPTRTFTGGSGTSFGTSSVVRTFYGGDEITCEAAVSGTGGTLGVTIDFSAIRLS